MLGASKQPFVYLRRFISHLQSTCSYIYSILLSRIYPYIPTFSGEIDSDLHNEVEEKMQFIGIRVRTFNQHYSNIVDYAAIVAFIGFILAIIVAFLVTFAFNIIPLSFWTWLLWLP